MPETRRVPMCRVLGCVAAERVSLGHELLEAPNPIIRQSEQHDSGWGIAAYDHGAGEEPRCRRFPEPAYGAEEFTAATSLRGRIFNVHVRRATIGGLAPENTHPFCLSSYSFSHNGTIRDFARLLEPGVRPPKGTTDSEHFFNLIMRDFDPEDAVNSLRRSVTTVIDRSPFSGLNFLFSDGERLYAYRLGNYELHWLARPRQLLIASEPVTDEEGWHHVRQDVILVGDPRDPEGLHAERLVGDEVVARADIQQVDDGGDLTGAERGAFAARQAARAAGSTPA